MFVFTFRKGGLRRLAAVCLCGAAIVGAAAAGIAWNRAQSTPANAALTQQITGSQDIASFLAGYGVEVDPTSAEVMAVKVPRKWDESFEAFHAVVQQSGLSLEKCKGKQVDKWTVPVPALCDDAKKTYAVVLVYKNEPKGAYLLEKPSGEVKPLVPGQSGTALTEEEKAVYRRGRNAKSVTMAKHATMKDYRMATGFEALMGYLYLTEQMERMAELLGHGLKKLGELEEDAQECIGAGENT